MNVRTFIGLLILGAVWLTPIVGQPQSPSRAEPKPLAEGMASAPVQISWISPPALNLAKTVGERLDYLVSWADYIVAARVRFEMKAVNPSALSDGLRADMEAQTVGVVRSLAMAVDDAFISFIDPVSGLPSRFERHLKEGNRRIDSLIVFDRKTLTARLDEKEIPISEGTRDVVAFFYHLRTLDLNSGAQHRLEAIYDDKPFTVLVTPVQKSTLETESGPVEAIELSLQSEEIRQRRAILNDEYRLRIWLSNDERRIPLLITARPPFGEVRVQLIAPEPPGQ